jgi:hypothetical protein
LFLWWKCYLLGVFWGKWVQEVVILWSECGGLGGEDGLLIAGFGGWILCSFSGFIFGGYVASLRPERQIQGFFASLRMTSNSNCKNRSLRDDKQKSNCNSKSESKSKDKNKSNRRSFDSLRSLRMTLTCIGQNHGKGGGGDDDDWALYFGA